HRRCAPVVHRQEEVRPRIEVDRAGRFPCRVRRRCVEEREENTGGNLNDHREQRRASEDVPVTRSARNVLGEEIAGHRHEAGTLVDPVEHRCSSLSPYAWYETMIRLGVLGWY